MSVNTLMHKIEDYIPIIFNPGSFGTYLNFVLDNLESSHIRPPFQLDGSSHNYKCNWLYYENGEFRLEIKTDSKYVLYHPKTSNEESIVENIKRVSNLVSECILIYPENDSLMISLNSYYYKRTNGSYLETLPKQEKDFLYSNWNLKQNTHPLDIPRWVVREYLSFRLIDEYLDILEWDNNIKKQLPLDNIYYLDLTKFLYHYDDTLSDIINYFGYTTNFDSRQELAVIHIQMLILQKTVNSDGMSREIILGLLENKNDNLVMAGLTIVDESYIQYVLRKYGYELKCNDLNHFPTHLGDLRNLIYKT